MAINIIICYYRINVADKVSKGGYRRLRNDVIRFGILSYVYGANRYSFYCVG